MNALRHNKKWPTRTLTAAAMLLISAGAMLALLALPDNASAAVIRRAPNNFGLVGYWPR